MPNPRLFCFGLGYTAGVLASRLLAHGWGVAGTTRGQEDAAVRDPPGREALVFDRGRPMTDAAGALAGATHLLSSVPPDRSGDPVIDAHAADIVGCKSLVWIGYLSTTGVYGDRGGEWVDEDAALKPTGERGRRRVAAEQAWIELHRRHGAPVHVFRLAGIYGPGRNTLAGARAGAARRVHKPGQVFSRVHVDDIATVLEASIARPNPGRIYNVCDDDPAPPGAVVAHACQLVGKDPPPLVALEDAGLSPMARGFYRDNRRVSNRRIKVELGVSLAYPDYRAGLAALLAQGE